MNDFSYMMDALLNSPEGAEIIAQLIVQLVTLCVQGVIGLAIFIMTAAGYYTIAKRRGISHAWLAWIPCGCMWILGSISDQYHQVVKGQKKSKRKILLTMSILSALMLIPFFGLLIAVLVMAISEGMGYYVEDSAIVGAGMGFLLSLVLVLVFSIVQTVFYYMSLYDLYRAASPSNAVLFLVLGIFVSITTPFFVFFNRKKDEGMIPMRPAFSPYQQPVYQQDPVYRPVPQQPVYQQDPVYRPAPQQPVYQQDPVYRPAPQQPVYQQDPVAPAAPQQPVYQQDPVAPAAPQQPAADPVQNAINIEP